MDAEPGATGASRAPLLKRAYYSASVADFMRMSNDEVLGQLSRNSELDLGQEQRNAWVGQLAILRAALEGRAAHLLLEYSIPRVGSRADGVLLLSTSVVVIEFKVGEKKYAAHAIDQVVDYALDLKNFQRESHNKLIVPILVATDAPERNVAVTRHPDGVCDPICTNGVGLRKVLDVVAEFAGDAAVDVQAWVDSVYSPTPTIIEAAQALYRGHHIEEISRSEAGAENLTKTADAINRIVADSRAKKRKSICFVTGVPGAGKTLAGLNIANARSGLGADEHAVFLSGNGPLVEILREALARDRYEQAKNKERGISKRDARREVKAFIQNVHHFRDEALRSTRAPVDRIAIFDEAQRAWDLEQTRRFMRKRKEVVNFDMSEPQFLMSYMDRHTDWATIVCLIGGGQEINTGEAGLAEWFRVLAEYFPEWYAYVPQGVDDSEYAYILSDESLRTLNNWERRDSLHLATSVRSFRAEYVSAFVKSLLDCDRVKAAVILQKILLTYPVRLTRDVGLAKAWLQGMARGTERYGVTASSNALRLKPYGYNVKADIDPVNWFLNSKTDIRSSYYLEDVATEFQIQGLELDWTCVAWDGDLRYRDSDWHYHSFSGTRWHEIKKKEGQRYLKNAYRVLLTRARQGMVIFVPPGDRDDHTRPPQYYDSTYLYLLSVGIPEISSMAQVRADGFAPKPVDTGG